MYSSAIALALGLAASAAHADSLADGSPSELLDYDDEWVADISQPTGMAFLPDGRLVITRRTGEVMVRTTDGELVEAGSFAVSTSFGEKGLLNVAVHPDYANNNIIFLYYTGQGNGGDDNRVVTMELSEDNVLDTETEIRLVEGIAAPLNHDGGGLAIDGNYLYIGTGDSGNNSSREPDEMVVNNYLPTCMTKLNGKILRLTVDGDIPEDNPLQGEVATACPTNASTCGAGGGSDVRCTEPTETTDAPRTEIFAWGFRNAFRVWADPKSHNLWVGHVGEVTYEMISVVPPTGAVHMGWPFREGNEGQDKSRCQDFLPNVGDCKDSAYHCEASSGNPGSDDYNPDVPDQCDSITGGLIFTGCEWPAEIEGKYVFGDYENERLWTFEVNDERSDAISERVDFGGTQGGGPVAFVEHKGALYVAVYSQSGGHITKITPKNPEAACEGGGPTDPPDGSAGAGNTPGEDGGPAPTDPTDTSEPTADDDTGTDPTDPADDTTSPGTDSDGPGGMMGGTPTDPTDPTDPPTSTTTSPTTTPTNPPGNTDDGTPGDDATGDDTSTGTDTATGEPAPVGSTPTVGDDTEEDSSCGCRTVGTTRQAPSGQLAAVAGLLLAGLWRRRSTSSRASKQA